MVTLSNIENTSPEGAIKLPEPAESIGSLAPETAETIEPPAATENAVVAETNAETPVEHVVDLRPEQPETAGTSLETTDSLTSVSDTEEQKMLDGVSNKETIDSLT